VSSTTAGWYPDPTSRFELRYHNGAAWTADVSTDGERYVDPNGARPSATPPTAPQGRNPHATASMVLGIVAIVIGWMPFVVALGAIAAVLAVVFGTIGRTRAKRSGTGGSFAVTGLITGAVGLLVCVGGVLLTVSLVNAIDDFENPPEHSVMITSCGRDGAEVTATGELTNLSTSASEFSVRLFFVRPGTDNPRRQALVELGSVAPAERVTFEVTRAVAVDEIDCIVKAVRGPLPYGIDPGT
jgi:hypothetical protein